MEGLLRGLRAPARGAPRARFAGAAGLVLLGEAALCALLVAFVPCARPPPPTPPAYPCCAAPSEKEGWGSRGCSGTRGGYGADGGGG